LFTKKKKAVLIPGKPLPTDFPPKKATDTHVVSTGSSDGSTLENLSERPKYSYSPFGELPRVYIKTHVKVFPMG
jgi:hypothetical protein